MSRFVRGCASSAIIFCGYRRRHARPVRSATWRKRGAARLFGRRLRHADTRASRTTRVHASGLTRSRMPEEALRELLAAPPPMRRRRGGSRLTVGGVSPSASRRAAARPCAPARDRPASCGCQAGDRLAVAVDDVLVEIPLRRDAGARAQHREQRIGADLGDARFLEHRKLHAVSEPAELRDLLVRAGSCPPKSLDGKPTTTRPRPLYLR